MGLAVGRTHEGADMGTGGLDAARLGRMRDVMEGHVERGAMPGLVTLVARRGEVHVEAIGSDGRRRQPADAPRCDLSHRLDHQAGRGRGGDDPGRGVPAAAGRPGRRPAARAGRPQGSEAASTAPLDDTVPAHRPITLRDLLTFRMGIGRGGGAAGAVSDPEGDGRGRARPRPAGRTDRARRVDAAARRRCRWSTSRERRWMYHTGSDVLGVLIARGPPGGRWRSFLTRAPLRAAGHEGHRIPRPRRQAGPAAAVLPARSRDGSARARRRPPPARVGTAARLPVRAAADWSRPPTTCWPSARMMLNKGRHGGERILSRPSVELMTTDQLTEEQKAGTPCSSATDSGWGLGISVITRRDDLSARPRAVRLERRHGHVRLHRSGRGADRDPADPAH